MQAMPTLNVRDGTVEQKRQEIKAYFLDSFNTYESLFSCLANDDVFYQRPEKLRHPLIFYFGHTATFFINKLVEFNTANHAVTIGIHFCKKLTVNNARRL